MRIRPAILGLTAALTACWLKDQKNGRDSYLPPWQPGELDLHHINTGRGNAAFYVLPDGTTVLVDAGDMATDIPQTLSPRNASIKPNDSKEVPEWIAHYIRKMMPTGRRPQIDYALITHYHEDHMGDWAPYRKISRGGYQLFGITGVAEEIPIRTLIDRSYPDYQLLPERRKERVLKTMGEYGRFIDFQKRNGMRVERFRAGQRDQIRPASRYPQFQVRNIVGNGEAWVGSGERVTRIVGEKPSENDLSLGIQILYGNFDCFTGGDISGIPPLGQSESETVESRIAPVIGEVDLATLNHHGNRDSQNSLYVGTLRPRVWIQQSWSADHPGEEAIRRITSTFLYPGERAVFATNILEATRHYLGPIIDQNYKGTGGHIVARVERGGSPYRIYLLDDTDPDYRLKSTFGPYSSRPE